MVWKEQQKVRRPIRKEFFVEGEREASNEIARYLKEIVNSNEL
jgi:hypothetical protein